jgi:glycosyltransferase involved in cell wall biosynthesis
MRLLINLTSLTNSGIIPIWLKKFQELFQQNHQIDFFFDNQINKINLNKVNLYKYNDSKKIKKLPQIKSKTKFIFYSIKKNLQSIFTIFKYRKNYDVFYSPSSVLDLVITPFFAKIYNPKIIWATVFDNIVPITDPGNKITRFLAWVFFRISLIFIRHADIIFTISPELRQFLIKNHFNKNKIVVTGNGIEIDLLKKAKKNNTYQFDALFIGRINETKGIFDMLEVLDTVKKTYPNFKLAILGKGDQNTKNKFTKQIKNLKLEKNIIMLGYIAGVEKFKIIKNSKSFWFLSVSKSESFGIALMEAVSCGIPSFAYKLPVFTKIYKNNEVIFSPIHRTDIVAKKVLSLFSSKKFSNPNGKKLLGKYTWENITKIENKAINRLITVS